jgi:hypothetical protein
MPQLKVHLQINPWISYTWWEIWPLLQARGWVATPYMSNAERKSSYQLPKLLEQDVIGRLTPGFHIFNSKIALLQYISR